MNYVEFKNDFKKKCSEIGLLPNINDVKTSYEYYKSVSELLNTDGHINVEKSDGGSIKTWFTPCNKNTKK